MNLKELAAWKRQVDRSRATVTPDPQPLNSLQAAAKRITGRRLRPTTIEKWQDEAWAMFDEVGELRFVAGSRANAVSRARLFAARIPDQDEHPEPVDPDESTGTRLAADTVRALGGGTMNRGDMLHRLAVHLFVAGESLIVGIPPHVLDDTVEPDDTPIGLAGLTWRALSTREAQITGERLNLVLDDDQSRREVDLDDAVVVRVWRPHPNRWWLADSPVKSNLPVLRELIGLTKHVGASIDSRLAGAGLLILPQSVEVVGAAVEDGDSPEGGPSSFVDALIETMTVPIRDRDSAAAVVPLVAKVPDDVARDIDQGNLIRFSTPFDDRAKDLRDEAIRRLALGLDAPPEVLLGMGSLNHWGAWLVEEQTVRLYDAPVLALIADALTTDYLWPVLEEAGVEDARDFVVWFDLSDVTLRPNRHSEATDLYDRSELSGEALRREAGFDDSDAPDVDTAVAAAINMATQAPSLIQNPGLVALVEAIRAVSGDAPAVSSNGQEPAESGMDLPDTRDEEPVDG